jgi:hypothetical protein
LDYPTVHIQSLAQPTHCEKHLQSVKAVVVAVVVNSDFDSDTVGNQLRADWNFWTLED